MHYSEEKSLTDQQIETLVSLGGEVNPALRGLLEDSNSKAFKPILIASIVFLIGGLVTVIMLRKLDGR